MPRRARQETLAAVRALPSAWPTRVRSRAPTPPLSPRDAGAPHADEQDTLSVAEPLPPTTVELFRRLDHLERQNAELLQLVRASLFGGRAPAGARPPGPRLRRRDGELEVWGGEGTGWGRYYGPASFYGEPDDALTAVGSPPKPPGRPK